jgi:hypothetical protein
MESPTAPQELPRSPAVLAAIALGFFAAILIRTAWICDDAYLTLRTVENAAAGHGLRWNVAERVQVYDHPLWLLILLSARLIARDTYFSTLGLSIGCSLLCLRVQLARPRPGDAVRDRLCECGRRPGAARDRIRAGALLLYLAVAT